MQQMTREADVAILAECIELMGDDEVATIALLAKRLLAGQRQYGRLDLAGDPRDFRKERGEELQDLLMYSAFEELRRSRK